MKTKTCRVVPHRQHVYEQSKHSRTSKVLKSENVCFYDRHVHVHVYVGIYGRFRIVSLLEIYMYMHMYVERRDSRGNSVVQSKTKQNFILDFCQSLEETVFSRLRSKCDKAIWISIIIFAQLKIPYDACRFPQYILKASTAVVANNCSKVDPNQRARPTLPAHWTYTWLKVGIYRLALPSLDLNLASGSDIRLDRWQAIHLAQHCSSSQWITLTRSIPRLQSKIYHIPIIHLNLHCKT